MSRGELLFSDLDHFKDCCMPAVLFGRSRPSAGMLHHYYFKVLFFTNLFHILFSKKLFQFVLKLDFKNWNVIVHRRFWIGLPQTPWTTQCRRRGILGCRPFRACPFFLANPPLRDGLTSCRASGTGV